MLHCLTTRVRQTTQKSLFTFYEHFNPPPRIELTPKDQKHFGSEPSIISALVEADKLGSVRIVSSLIERVTPEALHDYFVSVTGFEPDKNLNSFEDLKDLLGIYNIECCCPDDFCNTDTMRSYRASIKGYSKMFSFVLERLKVTENTLRFKDALDLAYVSALEHGNFEIAEICLLHGADVHVEALIGCEESPKLPEVFEWIRSRFPAAIEDYENLEKEEIPPMPLEEMKEHLERLGYKHVSS